jgi:hypothetical protein
MKKTSLISCPEGKVLKVPWGEAYSSIAIKKPSLIPFLEDKFLKVLHLP